MQLAAKFPIDNTRHVGHDNFFLETLIDVRHEPYRRYCDTVFFAMGLAEQVTQFEEQAAEVAKTRNTKFTALTRN